jgi:hypothetical protein
MRFTHSFTTVRHKGWADCAVCAAPSQPSTQSYSLEVPDEPASGG